MTSPAGSDGVIGNFKQGRMNDCFVLSAINAVGNTEAGKKQIKDDIKDNGDGTYTVKLPGDKAHKSYKVTQDDLKKDYASGDIDVNILAAAMEKAVNDPANKDEASHFLGKAQRHAGDNGEPPLTFNYGGDPIYLMKLLGGDQVKSDKSLSGKDGKDTFHDLLVKQASKVGKDSALVFTGTPQQAGGDWKPDDGTSFQHQFAVKKIDLAEDAKNGGTVYYTNPWDTSVVHKVSVNKLSKGLAESKSDGANLETINFSA